VRRRAGRYRESAPYPGQPTSLEALKREFKTARLPTAREMTGRWVAIGDFGAAAAHGGHEFVAVNCAGLKRGKTYEAWFRTKGYDFVGLDIRGYVDAAGFAPDGAGSLWIPADFGFDSTVEYRCRLTPRNTLACLIDAYDSGTEFKKLPPNRRKR